MRFDIFTVRVLRPTRLKNGGWIRAHWCKASNWSWWRSDMRAHGKDQWELRMWKLSIEYKREMDD